MEEQEEPDDDGELCNGFIVSVNYISTRFSLAVCGKTYKISNNKTYKYKPQVIRLLKEESLENTYIWVHW